MHHRQVLGTMLIAAATLAMTACGGSGGSTPSIPLTPRGTPTPTPTPGVGQATAQQQQPVTASGGTVQTTLPNNGTLSVQVPANALAANATVTIYAYTTAGQLPGSPFAAASALRKRNTTASNSLPAGAVFLGGFAVDTSGVAALAPLAVTETLQASVPSGDVVRVARYSSSGWSDVDTATVQNSAAVNDKNAKYVSVTPGGTANPYVVYAIPSASAAAPSAISIKSTSASALSIGGSAVYTSSGADAHGNPLPFKPSFDTDNHGMATASALATDALSATVTAGTQGGTVNLLASDSRTGVTGKTAISISTQRPSNAGDSFTFAGTLTQSDTYSYPTPNPLPADSKTAQVTQTVTVSATADPFGSGATVQDFTVKEQDAFPTQTLSSTANSYFQLGAANSNVSQYLLLGSNSTDDQGNTYSVQYASPGVVVDELPEASGQSWSNSPAMTLNENYTDLQTVKRSVNADGSYTDTETMYNSPIASPSPGDPSQDYPNAGITTNGYADGHATLAYQYALPPQITQNWGLPEGTMAEFDMAATAPGSNGIDILAIDSGWIPARGDQQPPFTNQQAVAQWYPSLNGSLYSETDKNLGSATIPSSCNVPASFGTAANKIEQQTSTVDPMMGTLETVQTDQYVVTGSGPVCVSVTDTANQYYNYQFDQAYSGDFSYFPVISSTPLVVTTVTETLALQSASVAAQVRTRDTAGARAAVPPVAVALARQHVQHLVHHKMAQRRVLAMHSLMTALVKGAQRK